MPRRGGEEGRERVRVEREGDLHAALPEGRVARQPYCVDPDECIDECRNGRRRNRADGMQVPSALRRRRLARRPARRWAGRRRRAAAETTSSTGATSTRRARASSSGTRRGDLGGPNAGYDDAFLDEDRQRRERALDEPMGDDRAGRLPCPPRFSLGDLRRRVHELDLGGQESGGTADAYLRKVDEEVTKSGRSSEERRGIEAAFDACSLRVTRTASHYSGGLKAKLGQGIFRR